MDKKSAGARELLESMFRGVVGAAHPTSALPPHLPAPPSRGRLVILAAGKAAGLDDASRGTALPRNATGQARRARGRPPRLRTADAMDPGHRSGTSGSGQDRCLSGETGAGARRRGGRRRSCPRVALRWRVGKLDRASARAHAGGKTGRHAHPVKERRQYRRDEYGSKTPLPHQGRPPCQARCIRPKS